MFTYKLKTKGNSVQNENHLVNTRKTFLFRGREYAAETCPSCLKFFIISSPSTQTLKLNINLDRPRQLPATVSMRNYRTLNADSLPLRRDKTSHKLQQYMYSVLWNCSSVAVHLLRTVISKTYKIHFFLNNQQDTLITQIYSVIKLYMFRAHSLLIMRSFVLYIRHW